MRVMTGAMFVSVWVLFHCQPAVADGIGGWPLLHWGMSRQQVEEAYPNFENWDHPNPFIAGGWEKLFGLKSYIVGGCPFSMYLEFLDNRLERIQLEAWVKKYGQFTTNNTDPSSPTLEWRSGETEISYMAVLDKRSENSWITVVYINKRDWLQWMSRRGKDRL